MDYISKELFIKKMEKEPYAVFLGRYYCLTKDFAELVTLDLSRIAHAISIGFNEEPCLAGITISDDVVYLGYEGCGQIAIDLFGSTKIIEDVRVYGIWTDNYLYVFYLAQEGNYAYQL